MTSLTNRLDKLPCHICNRIGLFNKICRCDKTVCMKHQFFIEHNCSYDYKKAERDRIEKENPVIRGEKVGVI